MLAWVVDIARRVVTPRATLAGTYGKKIKHELHTYNHLTALWSSQKDIQETETVIEQGTQTVTMKKDSWRANIRSTCRQEYSPETDQMVKTSKFYLDYPNN